MVTVKIYYVLYAREKNIMCERVIYFLLYKAHGTQNYCYPVTVAKKPRFYAVFSGYSNRKNICYRKPIFLLPKGDYAIMGKIQNQIGRQFETEWAEFLKSQGYWAYVFPVKNGQPCDIIAVKNGLAYFYECKTSNTDTFNTSRLESNQREASEYIQNCGNDCYYVVIKFKSGIHHFHIDYVRRQQKLCYLK